MLKNLKPDICPRCWHEEHQPDCVLGLREDIDYLFDVVNKILVRESDSKAASAQPKREVGDAELR